MSVIYISCQELSFMYCLTKISSEKLGLGGGKNKNTNEMWKLTFLFLKL